MRPAEDLGPPGPPRGTCVLLEAAARGGTPAVTHRPLGGAQAPASQCRVPQLPLPRFPSLPLVLAQASSAPLLSPSPKCCCLPSRFPRKVPFLFEMPFPPS